MLFVVVIDGDDDDDRGGNRLLVVVVIVEVFVSSAPQCLRLLVQCSKMRERRCEQTQPKKGREST